MSGKNTPQQELDSEGAAAWQRMSQSELQEYTKAHLAAEDQDILDRYTVIRVIKNTILKWVLLAGGLLSRIAFRIIHWSARAAGQPLVDLDQKYSADQMNQRISQLEILLLNQWSNINENDFSTPNNEIKKYLAACHVARQYDRVSVDLLRKRLDISTSKAETLVGQLVIDGVITEPYAETYYDVRRSTIDEVIARYVADLQKIAPSDMPRRNDKH